MTTTMTRPNATGPQGYTETLPCEEASARRARLLVSAALHVWGIGVLVDEAGLVVDEFVANAVRHTHCRRVRVSVNRLAEDRVRIGVADTSTTPPVMDASLSTADESGRGLVLVDALADRWGYDRHGSGRRGWKVVWAELTVVEPSC